MSHEGCLSLPECDAADTKVARVLAIANIHEVLTMKVLSFLSARLDVPVFCLVAALAAACSFDASQLQVLPDAAPDSSSAGADNRLPPTANGESA